MKFSDCIDIQVANKKLKPEKAEEAKRTYDDALEEALLEGLSPDAAENRAAVKAVERLGKMTETRKWQKVNEIKKAARQFDRFTATDRPDLELRKLADEWDNAANRIAGQATRLFINNIEASRPRMAGIVTPVRHHDNIVYAAYGDTRDRTAVAFHEEFGKVDEFLRKRANMEGASIPENPNRRIAQQQDRRKVLKYAKKHRHGVAGARAEWIQEHLTGLDWDMMRNEGVEIPVHKREEFLTEVYDSTLTRGGSRREATRTIGESLVNRMSRERFFYYKDAKTWLAMQKKYGAGSVYLQQISHIEIMARDIAMLEKMGPNPVSTLTYVENLAIRQAAEIDKLGIKGKSMTDKVTKQLSSFSNRFEIFNHLVTNGDASRMAQFIGTTRTLTMAGILDGAFIASLSDMGFGRNAGLMRKMPMTGYIRGVIKTFLLMPSAKRRREALEAGLNFESALRMALAGTRWMGPLDGAYRAQWIADVDYRLTWLTPWTQAGMWQAGRQVMGQWGRNAKTKFEKLPMVDDMRQSGITEADWDMFRQTPVKKEHGATLLRPVDVLDRTGLDPEAAQRLADKFGDYMAAFQRDAVPQADTLSQETLGMATPADRAYGQVNRAVAMLKSFPTVYFYRHMMETWRRAPSAGVGMVRLARFALMVTMMGAMITQLKEMAAGRDPMDMSQWQFWVRAALNGGTIGLVGDALFNGITRYQHGGLLEAFAGPLIEFGEKFRNLTLDNFFDHLNGKETNFGRDLVEFGFRYAPIPWQIKLALERSIYEQLLQGVDPKTINRLQQRERQRWENYKQKSWWPAGGGDIRTPNLGAMWGGSRPED